MCVGGLVFCGDKPAVPMLVVTERASLIVCFGARTRDHSGALVEAFARLPISRMGIFGRDHDEPFVAVTPGPVLSIKTV